ncbi:LuxR C-terminal-related transcriptional regulator [Pseudomonas putida]
MHTTVINADDLLVSSKFSPPRLNARHITREPLLARLREAQHGCATLITGPAGFGKTILLAQWRLELMRAGLDVAWLAFSVDDRQFASFLAYLLHALQRLGIGIDQEWLQSDGSEQANNTLVAIVTREAEALGKELHLLVDDFQHVESSAAHRLLQKLLDHCPANLHFTIASRATPPLSLGRLRMQGQVAEIDFAELPFGLEETREFFQQNLSTLTLSADEECLIHDLTRGWPASLQPIATMLRVRPSKRSQLRSILWKSSDLQAYLAEDVVACLPPELIEFMEKVSIFRRFNADLAQFVTGSPRAHELMKRAEDENLLVYRIETDDTTPWYRFHPLFGEFLAQRLAARGEPLVEGLHRRASQWFAEGDYLVEAVRHANLGGDLDYAVKAVEEATTSTWSMAYISPMLYLLERLPQETLFAHPRLFILGCLTYAFTARPDQARRWLDQIRRTEAARNPAVSSKFALADAAIALQLDQPRRVIGLLEAAHQVPQENRSLRYIGLSALAGAYLAVGRIGAVGTLFAQQPIYADDRDNDMALVFENTRAMASLTCGDAREAERLGASILSRAEEAYGRSSVSANLCAATLCDAYYELDRLDDALRVLANRSGILCSSMPDVMIRASLNRARITQLRESPQVALSFLESQAAHFHVLGLDRLLALMLAEQVRLLLGQGELRRATELLARLAALESAQPAGAEARDEIAAVAALSRARLALAEREPALALEGLAVMREFAEKTGCVRSQVKVSLLAALAHHRLEQEQTSREHLQSAIETAARLGLVRSVLDQGAAVVELLSDWRVKAPLEPLLAGYLQRLLVVPEVTVEAPAIVPVVRNVANGPRVNLTPREVEILGLVAQAMSNKRIALTLNITFGTVKWNVKNILAKLSVSSRYAAISLARQQGLLK